MGGRKWAPLTDGCQVCPFSAPESVRPWIELAGTRGPEFSETLNGAAIAPPSNPRSNPNPTDGQSLGNFRPALATFSAFWPETVMLTHASFCNGGASRRPVGVATAPAAYVEGRFRPLQWHGPDPVHNGCSSCARDGMKSTNGCCRTGCVLGRNRGAAPPRALARSRWKMRGQTSACRHGGQVSAWLGPPHGYVSFCR